MTYENYLQFEIFHKTDKAPDVSRETIFSDRNVRAARLVEKLFRYKV